ncbi:hypothetical protein [Desertivirga brevis]|uniref:hypothetical protein n=1 Tax=Desertivirga brevis TaxID=2810310 RepID=UPI001A959ECE|nr:hypothetical protein [Pedobacter sp. SYSU D00873]
MTNTFRNKCFLVLPVITILGTFSCQKNDQVAADCYQGVIIGKIRTNGGGVAVSVNSPIFGTHEWRDYKNVVEALNLKSGYNAGTKIYFKARAATDQEKIYPITADGDESAKPIIYITSASSETCPD